MSVNADSQRTHPHCLRLSPIVYDTPPYTAHPLTAPSRHPHPLYTHPPKVYENLVTQLEVAPADGAAADAAASQQKPEDQKPRGGPVADLPADQQALAWIQYMRFLRRVDVQASRRVSHGVLTQNESDY